MAYQAIYRKWRPLVFDDIVGQTHITQTLKNQILSGKVAHAYLFCGTRGTGKTTAAKVFARAVNCINNTTGSPCNECEVCKGILDGSILEVSEIDAASNNSVENIRAIQDELAYSATQSKYRVYIIDEVHMLSESAFNALLKTLEEPPEHVIFILATTEVHKLPQTILSRCQRFDFKRIRPSDIILRMREIASGDGLNITDDAYMLLAKLADGSMRDGLSVLERCVSASGNNLTEEDIVSVLGIATSELTFNTAAALIDKDTGRIISIIDKLVSDGRDLNSFADNVISHFRDLLVCKAADKPEDILDYSSEDIVKLKGQSTKASFEKISNIVTALSEAKSSAKWVKNPRVIYELAFIKLTRPELDDSKEALLVRLNDVEEKIKNGIEVKTVAAKDDKKESEKSKKKKEKPSERIFKPIDKNTMTAENPIVVTAKNWERILKVVLSGASYLAPVRNKEITIDGEGIIIMFENTEVPSKAIIDLNLNTMEDMVRKASGADLRVKTAIRSDIEDYIIDFWSLPGGPEEEIEDIPEFENAEPEKEKLKEEKTEEEKTEEEKSSEDDVNADNAGEISEEDKENKGNSENSENSENKELSEEPDEEFEEKSEGLNEGLDDLVNEELGKESGKESGEALNEGIVEDEPVFKADPIDELANKYPEIVEFTDDSEFINYNAGDEHFEQASIDDTEDDDDREEFLEKSECMDDDE